MRLIIEMRTPMAEIARNNENSVFSIEIGRKNFPVLFNEGRIILTNDNGYNFSLVSKYFINVGHMHLKTMLVFFLSFRQFRKLGFTFQNFYFYVKWMLHEVSTLRLPKGVSNSLSPEIEHPTIYFLCEGPKRNILEHLVLFYKFWICK